jgi:hypothetical protein
MSLFNQSDSPAFFCPRKVNLKIYKRIAQPRKMALADGFIKSSFVVRRDFAHLDNPSSGIWPFSVSHLPDIGHSRKVIFRENCPISVRRYPGIGHSR